MSSYLLMQEFTDLSYKTYGNFNYAAGFMQSAMAGLLDGMTTKEDMIDHIQSKIHEMKENLK